MNSSESSLSPPRLTRRAKIRRFRHKVRSSWRRVAVADLRTSLILAVILAVLWWGFIAFIFKPIGIGHIWIDQEYDFTQVGKNLADPYQTPRYVYPPWTAVFLWPFSHMSLYLAVLIQLIFYFVGLTLLAHRYGGNNGVVLLTLTSYAAFSTSIETNIDWLSYIGLLIPPILSGPLLLTKPQLALGIWLTYKPKEWLWGGLLVVFWLLGSLVIWPTWPQDMLEAVRTYTLNDEYRQFNLAPSHLMPFYTSYLVAAYFAWRAIRRRDPIDALYAWLFFVPYIPAYSLILYFMITAIRWPLLAHIIYVATWIIYGGVILWGVILLT